MSIKGVLALPQLIANCRFAPVRNPWEPTSYLSLRVNRLLTDRLSVI
jgi:hypothetical protein